MAFFFLGVEGTTTSMLGQSRVRESQRKGVASTPTHAHISSKALSSFLAGDFGRSSFTGDLLGAAFSSSDEFSTRAFLTGSGSGSECTTLEEGQ